MMLEQLCSIRILLDSAKEVFETMVFMDLAEAENQDQQIDGWALMSSITFKGQIEGCLAICCNTSCAKAITENMLAIDCPDEISEQDVCDTMGEIANMVMGSLKTRLIESNGYLESSIPTVISGRILNCTTDKSEQMKIMVNIQDEHIAEFLLSLRK